jgi:hypothetical protein
VRNAGRRVRSAYVRILIAVRMLLVAVGTHAHFASENSMNYVSGIGQVLHGARREVFASSQASRGNPPRRSLGLFHVFQVFPAKTLFRIDILTSKAFTLFNKSLSATP